MIPAHEVRKEDRFDPLLVSLHDNAKSYIQNMNDQDAVRDLIESVAALLDAELNANERVLASEVLISLVRQAEQNMRHGLALKLSMRTDVPETLLHYLVYDDIDAAGPILQNSALLSELDLSYIIHSKGAEHWQAIAARPALSDKLVSQLVSKQDEETLVTLLKNEGIDIAEDILREFVPTAKQSSVVANELVAYKSLSKDVALDVYFHVSMALRHKILSRFDVSASDIDEVMEDCVQDFTDTMMGVANMKPSPLMVEVASAYNAQGRITVDTLVNVLRHRQGRFFIALFAEKTGLSHAVVHGLMKQVGGQGLAVACRAGNINRQDFMSMFLISRAIARPEQAVNAVELKTALRYFDGLSFELSYEILEQSIAR